MASKNSVKIYADNSFYHVYNRGVEKRTIFLDEQDYSVFLSYLSIYLCPKDEVKLIQIIGSTGSSPQEKNKALKLLRLKNYADDIALVCYALMPNHFHLLLRQNHAVLQYFMNSIGTRYSMYFNRKYKRKGVLFQDVYKAVLVDTDEQLLHLSRYIHLNPIRWLRIPVQQWSTAPFPCSLSEYIGKRKTPWIKKNYVLDYFSKTNPKVGYENFLGLPDDPTPIYTLAIDIEE